MDNDPKALAFEIKITMTADGTKTITAADGNGATMNLFDVRDAFQWALTTMQEKIIMAFVQSAIVESQKPKKKTDTLIIPTVAK